MSPLDSWILVAALLVSSLLLGAAIAGGVRPAEGRPVPPPGPDLVGPPIAEDVAARIMDLVSHGQYHGVVRIRQRLYDHEAEGDFE